MTDSAPKHKPRPGRTDWSIPVPPKLTNAGGNRKALRFQLTLPVRYRTDSDAGWGTILNIGGNGALFTTERPLALMAEVELRIKWPVLLLDSAHLTLVAVGTVVRLEPGHAAVRFKRYMFRTCSPSFFTMEGAPANSPVDSCFQVQVAN